MSFSCSVVALTDYSSVSKYIHSFILCCVSVSKYIHSFPLFQGYINTGSPGAAFRVHDEMLLQGLQPDKLTYNTLILAAVKMENLDSAMKFLEEMKVPRKY